MTSVEKLATDAPVAPSAAAPTGQHGRRWHVLVFLAPALIVYSALMVIPLADTLRLALFRRVDGAPVFAGLANFVTLFTDPAWSGHFWLALRNNVLFFVVHLLLQNPIGVALAALLSLPGLRGGAAYRTVFFLPTMLSFVIVGFTWKLILSPLWGVAPMLMGLVGLRAFFHPWLGQESSALLTLTLISVWQYVGIPMMLIYAALLGIPDEVIEAAELDGVTGFAQFRRIKLPLILPNYATDILGTLLFRTFFGNQLQLGDPNMGAAVATVMFGIILAGVCVYLFGIQTRLRRYQF